MTLTTQLESLFDAEARRAHSKHQLRVGLAHHHDEVRAFQRLRHQVFVGEMGARLDCLEPGIESDRYDLYCQHLLVWDDRSDQVVGGYRLLTDTQAARAGGFYSESEFDLGRILAVPGRRVEVGRTCVHPDYRGGAVISLLWSGLARFMLLQRFDYLMGCASIPLSDGIDRVSALWHETLEPAQCDAESRVFPLHPLPLIPAHRKAAELPPLIRAYLRAGAQVCGEPAWDTAFGVADVFLLLSLDRITARYTRHFIRRG